MSTRPGGAAPSQAISAFFQWWAGARPRIERALAAGALDPLIEEISRHVEALSPGMGWEIGPGVDGGSRAFALAWGGDLARRRVGELWRRAAPIERDGWVFHPAFARLPGELSEQLAALAVTELLGEDGRARWVGDLEAVRARPREAEPLGALRARVDALAADERREGTDGRFALLEGENAGRPAFALVNRACHPLDHLGLDTHLRIEIEAADAREDGLPTPDELQALDAIEEDLQSELGDAALFFAHETGSARRVVHFFVAGEALDRDAARRARAAVDEWRSVHGDDRAITATWTADPDWDALARFG